MKILKLENYGAVNLHFRNILPNAPFLVLDDFDILRRPIYLALAWSLNERENYGAMNYVSVTFYRMLLF